MISLYDIRRYALISLLIFVKDNCLCSEDVKREFNFTVNPQCIVDCDKPWLIYGKGDIANNSIHHLWSVMKLPSFVMAASVPDSDIQVDWDALQAGKPGAISFTKVPENVFGVSFQKLILFNDVNDTGKLDNIPEDYKKYASLSDFEWSITKMVNSSSQEFYINFTTTSFRGSPLENGTKISISVTAYGADGRSDDLPHLITTPESAQIKVVLDNLILDLDGDAFGSQGGSSHHSFSHQHRDTVMPISGFDHPRWALDAIIISDDSYEDENMGFIYSKDKSLDDEHTPGVFDIVSIVTQKAKEDSTSDLLSGGGFLQWRPVCYLTTDEDVNDSTYPNVNSSLPSVDSSHFNASKESLMYVLFGENFKNLLSAQTPIAFGLPKDGFYTEYKYTEWTISVGLGVVPKETFSVTIIIVICVGVGLPALLFLAGGVFLSVRKLRQRGQPLLE